MGRNGWQMTEGLANAREMGSDALEELRKLNSALRTLIGNAETSPVNIAVTDADLPGIYQLSDFPVPGYKRFVSRRLTSGQTIAVPDTPQTQIVGANQNRLGGQIVNSGAFAIVLSLGPTGSSGVGQIWIGPNGGAWDFRLGNLVWCGAVAAEGDGGASTLTICEV